MPPEGHRLRLNRDVHASGSAGETTTLASLGALYQAPIIETTLEFPDYPDMPSQALTSRGECLLGAVAARELANIGSTVCSP